jgi:hypothetical protein
MEAMEAGDGWNVEIDPIRTIQTDNGQSMNP